MRKKEQAFTLIEIAIAVFILLLILMLAIPSVKGVLADRRLRRSLDEVNRLVHTAQEHSVNERRPYLITWEKDQIVVQPEAFADGEEKAPTAKMAMRRGDALALELPAALSEKPPPEWIFWPSGTCEPAIVSFKGVDGTWTARYSPLTARAEISSYAAK